MTRRRLLILALSVTAGASVATDFSTRIWSQFPMTASFVSAVVTLGFTLLVIDEVVKRREVSRLEPLLAHHAELLAEETNRIEQLAGKIPRKRPTEAEMVSIRTAIHDYRLLLVSMTLALAVYEEGLRLLTAARAFSQELERVVNDDYDNAHFGMPPEDRTSLKESRRAVHQHAWPLYGRYLAGDKRNNRLNSPGYSAEYVTGKVD